MSENWQKVKTVFDSVADLASGARAPRLAELCSGDDELRRRVEDLLAAYDTGFLENGYPDPNDRPPGCGAMTQGEKFGHYEIVRLLGSGGMGKVYLARDVLLHREVAIKVITAAGGSDEAHGRLLREARAAASLDHPNICSIYEVGKSAGTAYIAMQYVDGDTLASRLSAGPMDIGDALRFAIDISEALAAAHARGIIHRDIKPENIMLTRSGVVKVMDFGLAKIAAATDAASEDETRMQFTEPGMILGTPAYMSPEQAKGESLDLRTDIFSLGTVLYEMLTRQRLFDASSTAEVLVAILTREPEPIGQYANDIPLALEQVVTKMLAKDRGARFTSMEDIVVELKQCRDILSGVSTARSRKLTSSADKHQPPSRSWAKLAALTVAIAMIAGLTYAAYFIYRGGAEQASIRSLAVLPLENLSGDPSQDYFADGMTEALISQLSQIGALKVISRTSVMRFKGSRMSVPEIAQALGVDAVIEGSVQRSSERVRVTAQLIPAMTDSPVWSRNYERELSDVLKLQSDVAQAIAREIRIQVTPAEEIRLASANSIDPKAHEAYLLGQFHRSKLSEVDLARSIEYFQEAIRIEPNYSNAYAGLSNAWLDRGIWGSNNIGQVESEARDAALNAIRIDPRNSYAHTAMCVILVNYDHNWTEGETEVKRALEIDPNSVEALEAYAWLLQSLGRFEEMHPQIERAQRLDPVSSRIQSAWGRMLYRARLYADAETKLKRAIELDPLSYAAYGRLGDVYIEMGRFEEAIAAYEKSMSMQPHGAHALRIAVAYARMGDKQKALEQYARTTNRPNWELARLHTALDEPDKAFEAINRGLDSRDTLLVHVKVDPSFDRLHSDPRWRLLLRRLNFPE